MSLDNVKNIVLVLSGKGGVGKSSITTQLALSLSLAGHSVGILDVDLTGPSIPRLLGIEASKVKQAPGGWLPVQVHASQILQPVLTLTDESTAIDNINTTSGSNGAVLPLLEGASVSNSYTDGARRTDGTNDRAPPFTNTTFDLSSDSTNASLPSTTLPSFSDPFSTTRTDPTSTTFSDTTSTSFSNPAFASSTTSTSASSASPLTSKPIGSLHAMSLAFLLTTRSSAIVWRGPKKTAMVRQFLTSVLWGPTDYLLIDTPPGTSDEHISLVETLLKSTSSSSLHPTVPNLAGAVIVTTPQEVATSDVRKELNFCGKVGVKVLGVVENMSGYVCECCGVETNVFSKGGGKKMSRDFGVKFLGGVPLDGQWGVLIEEGRRPRYGGVKNNKPKGEDGYEDENEGREEDEGEDEEDDEEEEEDEEEETETEIGQEERDALLIDKYRSCSLYPIFAGITKRVVETVENGTAVTVGSVRS